MDILTVILLIVILIVIISNKSNVSDRLRELENRIFDLQNLLRQREQQNKIPAPPQPEVKPAPSPRPPEFKAPVPPPAEVKAPEPPKPEAPLPPPVVERHPEPVTDRPSHLEKPVKSWADQSKPVKKETEPELSFFERYPDLEKFIGENLVNKIGITILVLAVGFFVKYAIDNDWIGRPARVGIGILCGAILVGIAHWLRNSYKAFSSVMAGGGIAVFYFSITLAFQQFHLFSQTVAFAILIVITIFAVVLALLYDKQELAVIALLGGFGSPFMVSNGSSNYNALFIYLLILNIGLLIIAYYKAWRILNISSFALSVIVFSVVLYTLTPANHYIGFRYATIFYLLFFTINIINNIRENKSFLAIDFSILLINTALYFATGLYLLTLMHQTEYRGLFSAALALINLVLSYILFRKKTVDPNILYLLIGITLTFISLTAPIQLHGNNITLFWASETVLLYWLYLKSDITLMKLASIVIWVAMILSLYLDVLKIYGQTDVQLAVISNKGFITAFCGAISSYLLYVLVKKDRSPQIYGLGVAANLFRIFALILLFAAGYLEIKYQFDYYYPNTDIGLLYLMLYLPLFAYLFNLLSAKINGLAFSWRVGMGLMIFAVVVFLGFMTSFFSILDNMLEHRKPPISHFMAHWLGAVVIAFIFQRVIVLCRDNFDEGMKNLASWVLSAAIVLFLSLEFCLAAERLFFSAANGVDLIQTVYIKTGLPVLWGVSSFILMWVGMRKKLRTLRIISLTLFLITLIKLFLFDINNIPVAGKIIAFFCLGVLLLIISFMYQKVKKIIVDDEAKKKE